MPAKRIKGRKAALRRKKRASLPSQYRRFFCPTPSPLWQEDNDQFSLEQPSPLKYFPSETVNA
jgi:hypothetical protein